LIMFTLKCLGMKANELRIGNYVKDPYGKTIKLTSVEKDAGMLRPVPLTEEWLLKFGWVWNQECNSFEKYPNGDSRMNLDFQEVSNSYTMFNYVLKAKICDRIFHVHQLQNLFFALTGEELTIKDDVGN